MACPDFFRQFGDHTYWTLPSYATYSCLKLGGDICRPLPHVAEDDCCYPVTSRSGNASHVDQWSSCNCSFQQCLMVDKYRSSKLQRVRSNRSRRCRHWFFLQELKRPHLLLLEIALLLIISKRRASTAVAVDIYPYQRLCVPKVSDHTSKEQLS